VPRPPSAQIRARQFLVDYFGKHSYAGPISVKSLAVQAGVSYRTMWEVVRRCKEQGLLRGGYRVSVADGKGPVEKPPSAAAPMERLRGRLIDDLLSGTITRGKNLLSVKELTVRYATSPRTLRRVLLAVESQGLIVHHGRHYSGLDQAAAGRLSIVVLAYLGEEGEGFALPPLEREFLTCCEAACGNTGISLSLVGLGRSSGPMEVCDVRGAPLESIPAGQDVAGYLYLIHSPEAFDDMIMRRLAGTRKPVAVLDGAGIFPRDNKAYDTPRVRIFAASAFELPGRRIAAYLLSRGHRHAAYISPFHADQWSHMRCEGARRAFALAGEKYSLSIYAADHSIKGSHFEDEGRKLSRAHTVEKIFGKWRARIHECFRPDMDTHLLYLRRAVFMWGAVRATMEPLLLKAIDDRRISAWIMANDSAARIALQYCQRTGIPVPGRIAIIGFDDVDVSRDLRISSYNFNLGAVATAIVHFLLHPQSGHWQRRRIVEIEGRIVERSTT
jgi:DNA-binding LacI/PurR family transcriptional regulator